MVSQRDAVYAATVEALSKANITFNPTITVVKEVATDSLRDAVVSKVFTQLKTGEVALKSTEANAKKLADEAKLKSYVSSLVSNHWSRDPKLNGGIKN